MNTSLYRYFDKDGQLLYVGITKSLFNRQDQHSRTQPWWNDVASATFEHFDDRDIALAFEEQAIYSEWPLYNKAGNTIDINGRNHLLAIIDSQLYDDAHKTIAQNVNEVLSEIAHLVEIPEKLLWLFAFDRAFSWTPNGEDRIVSCTDCQRVIDSAWFSKTLYIADGLVCNRIGEAK